ncbi:hypothetical protein Esti_006436 [Eimeria stiedai]
MTEDVEHLQQAGGARGRLKPRIEGQSLKIAETILRKRRTDIKEKAQRAHNLRKLRKARFSISSSSSADGSSEGTARNGGSGTVESSSSSIGDSSSSKCMEAAAAAGGASGFVFFSGQQIVSENEPRQTGAALRGEGPASDEGRQEQQQQQQQPRLQQPERMQWQAAVTLPGCFRIRQQPVLLEVMERLGEVHWHNRTVRKQRRPEARIYCVVRNNRKGGCKQTREALASLGLTQQYKCTLIANDEHANSTLRKVAPFVFYGLPKLETIRRLFLTRHADPPPCIAAAAVVAGGAAVVALPDGVVVACGACCRGRMRTEEEGESQPISNNVMIEDAFGSMGIVCLEDLIQEVFTCGPHFRQIMEKIGTFQLANLKAVEGVSAEIEVSAHFAFCRVLVQHRGETRGVRISWRQDRRQTGAAHLRVPVHALSPFAAETAAAAAAADAAAAASTSRPSREVACTCLSRDACAFRLMQFSHLTSSFANNVRS